MEAGGSHEDPSEDTGGLPPLPAGGRPDARVARGNATRTAMLGALLTLLREGTVHPTVATVAARAHVATRSIYYHFGGIHGLLAAAVVFESDRHRSLLSPVTPKGATAVRIAAVCRQRRAYFEAMTPVLLAVRARPEGEDDAVEVLTSDRIRLREQLARTFAVELGRRSAQADELLDALDNVTGWDSWRTLRHVDGRSAPAAERVMALSAFRILG